MADSRRAKINRVLGMPPMWTEQVDPGGRAFSEMFMADAFILNLMPGVPKFIGGALRNAKTEALEKALREQTGNGIGLYEGSTKIGPPDEWQYHAKGSPERKVNDKRVKIKEKDLRFYSFAPNWAQYKRAVNILVSDLANKMIGFGLDFSFEKYVDDSDMWKSGLAFYLEGSSTASESMGAELGESAMAQAINSASQMATEMSFLSGNYESATINQNNSDNSSNSNAKAGNQITASEGRNLGNKIAGVGNKAMEMMGEAAGHLTDSKGLTKVASAGEKLIFPKVWRGCSYDKSYSLNFKFISPTGDANSIMQYVYFPFICLLVLALPRQGTVESYKSPFIVRCDCPGYFACDMGMVTSFSFTRGGSEDLWTDDGLPQCIDVSMSITDVYANMCMSLNSVLHSQNLGMQTLMTNMANLEMMRFNFAPCIRANIARRIHSFTGIGGYISDATKDTVISIGETIFGV